MREFRSCWRCCHAFDVLLQIPDNEYLHEAAASISLLAQLDQSAQALDVDRLFRQQIVKPGCQRALLGRRQHWRITQGKIAAALLDVDFGVATNPVMR